MLFVIISYSPLALQECFHLFLPSCKCVMPVASLWLQWMNKYSSNMNVVDILGYLLSKMKVKNKKTYVGT